MAKQSVSEVEYRAKMEILDYLMDRFKTQQELLYLEPTTRRWSFGIEKAIEIVSKEIGRLNGIDPPQ